jgi:glycosyltransferase involved in cell wall biosynthesis
MLGFLVGEETFERFSKTDANPQVAARKLESAYIEGFFNNGISVGSLSFFPATTYPGNEKFFYGFSARDKFSWSIPFINFPLLKLLSRLISSVVSFYLWRLINGRVGALCIYSAHSPFLIAAVIIRFFSGTRFFVIVPDLPSMMNEGSARGRFFCLIKRFDQLLIEWCLSYSSGLSFVTEQMSEKLSKNASIPYVVIEGLATEKNSNNLGVVSSGRHLKPYFMYSGGISEAYGVGCAIRALVSTNINADFFLCGSGPLEGYINDIGKIDNRIKWLGFLGQQQLRDFQSNALALILVRSPTDEFVKYSFPSKLIEYMISGRPVICTRLPGIPDVYFEYLMVIDDCDEGTVAAALNSIFLDADIYQRRALRGVDFIKTRTNPTIRVKEFLALMFPDA